MKVEAPLLERACRRFPIDSEQITGMRYIADDFIEFDMFRVGSLEYLHSDDYEMFAPYDTLEALANNRYFCSPECMWDEDDAENIAYHLSMYLRDRYGYVDDTKDPVPRSAQGYIFRFTSPSGMHRAVVTVMSDREWIIEITQTANRDPKVQRDRMLDDFYKHIHRFDLPMGML